MIGARLIHRKTNIAQLSVRACQETQHLPPDPASKSALVTLVTSQIASVENGTNESVKNSHKQKLLDNVWCSALFNYVLSFMYF